MTLEHRWAWTGGSGEPQDEQFGDIVERATLEEAGDYDAVLVGEPYDGAVAGRAGAREGPAAIREALAAIKTHHFDAGPVESVGDIGTVEVPGGESVSHVQETLQAVAESVHDTDTVPIFLGGDGSLTYANVAPLLQGGHTDGGYIPDGGFGDDEEVVGDVEHFDPTGGNSEPDGEDSESETDDDSDENETGEQGETTAADDDGPNFVEKTGIKAVSVAETVDRIEALGRKQRSSEMDEPEAGGVGVVSLDAHLDYRAVDGQPTSGTAYRQLLDEGLDALAVLGTRHFETTTAYATELHDEGGAVVTAEEVAEDSVAATERALDAMAGVSSVYVSVDMDVLDTTAAPGVSSPTPGGITTRELFRMLRLLASDDRLAGIEIVETAPPLCPDGRTARAAARAVAHALSVAEES